MKKIIIVFSIILTWTISAAQDSQRSSHNFDFEDISSMSALPTQWFHWGTGYDLAIDTLVKHGGRASVRIQQEAGNSSKSFGCVAHSMPVNFSGRYVIVKAFFKLNKVDTGKIGLLLRIDGLGKTLAFDNMDKANIHGSSDWKLYSLKLPLPVGAKTVHIGALLSGSGQLWVDDFQVLIDGKDLRNVKIELPKEYGATKDREFDNLISRTPKIDLNKTKIEHLALLGKVWGFLKYYHPTIGQGEYNWDYELLRIIPKIMDAPSDQVNTVLSSWIKSLGAIEDQAGRNINGRIKLLPDLSWIDKSRVGEELYSQLIKVKDAKRTDNYYVSLIRNVLNPEFNNEEPYTSLRYPDAGFQLLSLFRYWNIIQYFFPDKHLIGEDWNDVLVEFVPAFVNASTEREYKLAALRLIARIHDTHANIWSQDMTPGKRYAPVELSFIENKAVVTDYLNDNLALKSELRIGDVLQTIDGKSVDEIVKGKLPFTPASNYPTQLRDIARVLLKTDSQSTSITYVRGGSVTAATLLPTYSPDKLTLFKKHLRKDSCFKLITPEISYLFPGTIRNKYLPELISGISKTKGLIIDFRCYPSDFVVFSLSQFLLPHRMPFAKFSHASLSTPGLFTLTGPIKAGKSFSKSYKGKIVIIINEITQSSAEYHTMAFRAAPGAVVIGSQTAGADGNVSAIVLPGGIRTMISGIGVYYPDGKETQRIGIVPDIEINPTIKGIAEGRDELLEKAIEIINKN